MLRWVVVQQTDGCTHSVICTLCHCPAQFLCNVFECSKTDTLQLPLPLPALYGTCNSRSNAVRRRHSSSVSRGSRSLSPPSFYVSVNCLYRDRVRERDRVSGRVTDRVRFRVRVRRWIEIDLKKLGGDKLRVPHASSGCSKQGPHSIE